MILEYELNLAGSIARHYSRKWSGADYEDLKSVLTLWLYENLKTVERYRIENGGVGKLNVALSRAAQAYAKNEQKHSNRQLLEDGFTYTTEQIENAIPFIWEYYNNPDDVGSAKDIMLDIIDAYKKLSHEDQIIIELHYHMGVKIKDIAIDLNIKPSTVYKKLSRAFEKMQTILG